jgi:hypothetical protein
MPFTHSNPPGPYKPPPRNTSDRKNGQPMRGANPTPPVNPVGSGSQDFLAEAHSGLETVAAVVLGYVAGNAAEKLIRRHSAARKANKK